MTNLENKCCGFDYCKVPNKKCIYKGVSYMKYTTNKLTKLKTYYQCNKMKGGTKEQNGSRNM